MKTPTNKLSLVMKAILVVAYVEVLACVIWYLFLKDNVSFYSMSLVLAPYVLTWFLLSLLSITISGIQFKALWMGTFTDDDVFSMPSFAYSGCYLFLVLVIYIVQYELGMLGGIA